MKNRFSSIFKSGAIIDTNPLVVGIIGASLPATVTLRSVAVGRKIEVSYDNGVEYYPVTADKSSTTSLVAFLNSCATHVRFTGAHNDAWAII